MASEFEEEPDDLWDHQQAAKKLIAQYANRIFAQPLSEGPIRISFGEMSETFDPTYHTAIVVTPGLAKEFAQVINQVADRALAAQAEYENAKREREAELIRQAIAAVEASGKATPTDGN